MPFQHWKDIRHKAEEKNTAKEWHFDFCIFHKDLKPVAEIQAELIMNTIIDLCEAKGLRLGGGYNRVEEQ